MYPNLIYNNNQQLDISGSVNISKEAILNSSGTNQLKINDGGFNYKLGNLSGTIKNIDLDQINKFDAETSEGRVYRRSSIPTSDAVSNLVRKYAYISPFDVKITPGNPCVYSIELNSKGISGMRFDIKYSWDIDSAGNIVPSITTAANLDNTVAKTTMKNCLKASRTLVINGFVNYVPDARFSYIDSTTNQRIWLPNRFTRYIDPSDPNTLYIGDENNHRSFSSMFAPDESHTFYPPNIENEGSDEYFLIQNNVSDSDASTSKNYISLNFLYENINLGPIDSIIDGYGYGDYSILSYFNMFSWPFDISFSENTVFGPNLSSLFRNRYNIQDSAYFAVNQNAIRNISGLKVDPNVTNFTGMLRQLNFKSIKFVPTQTFDVSKCVQFGDLGLDCNDCKLTEFIEAFQIKKWSITSKEPVDLHSFLSACGMHEYFNPIYGSYLNLINLTTTDEILDLSGLNGTGQPLTGHFYRLFSCLMYPGPLKVPSIILDGNFDDTYSLFANSLVTEILNLNDINVDNAFRLFSTFDSCYNLKSIDISSWNLDNAGNLMYFIYDAPNLTSLKIKSKYIEFDSDNSIIIKNDKKARYKPMCYTYVINVSTSTINYAAGGNVLSGYIATNKDSLDASAEVWTIQFDPHVTRN